MPVACWGLTGYAFYQGMRFDAPFAFVKTQSHWGLSSVPISEKLTALLAFEPIWQVYDRGSAYFWAYRQPHPHNPLFCWTLVNPPCFVVSAILISVGAFNRWLSSYEATLAVTLLLIPYFGRGYEMVMGSQARFAAVVFPVYLVLGNILARLPGPIAGSLLAVSAFYLGAFSALFASWHLVF